MTCIMEGVLVIYICIIAILITWTTNSSMDKSSQRPYLTNHLSIPDSATWEEQNLTSKTDQSVVELLNQ